MTHEEFDLSALADRLHERPDLDLVREMVTFLYQALIDQEATEHIGAEPHERSITRRTRRNGSRSRKLSSKAGDIDLKIPKLRKGSFFPSILERRRRIDQALYAVVIEAYVHGVSTRKVDDLVQALGVDAGISKSEVSRICQEMDVELDQFRTRDLSATTYPYVFLDATYVKGRVDKRVVSRACVVAMGVSRDGNREILGIQIGDSEDKVFWTEFLQSLRSRGLAGVELVISDHHLGLKGAIQEVLVGSAWQRCRVHLHSETCSPRSPEPRARWSPRSSGRSSLRAMSRPSSTSSRRLPVRSSGGSLSLPTCSETPETTSAPSPASRRATGPSSGRTTRSSGSTPRPKRRTRVVGIFPNDASALRLITAVCLEQNDEWIASERRYLSEQSMAQLASSTIADGLQARPPTLMA